jgi:phospholipid/cholesterol/gamma-HCH transport system substrate-binding protein
MPRPKRWADLVPGLAALVIAALGIGGVFAFARVGSLRGRTDRLYAALPSARGVIPGTEVWLAGRQIGTVKDVVFRPPALDTAGRIVLVLDILARDRQVVRRDSDIRIRSGDSFIGSLVVAISEGSASAPPARPGDTLVSRGPTYVERARADLAAAGAQVPLIISNLSLLAAQLRSARGTLGALGASGSATAFQSVASAGGALMTDARQGSGTVGLALRRNSQLTAVAGLVMAQVDSVRRLVSTPTTSVGRFRRDSTLLANVATLRNDVADLAQLAESPDGTTGRLRGDAALRQQLARTRGELDALLVDLKRNPLRYVSF